jgi:hypothetical protein
MISADRFSCTRADELANFPLLFPNWDKALTCDLPAEGFGPSFWVQLAATVITAIAVAVALWQSYQAKTIAVEADRKALERDQKSRALASHEKWTESFFHLGATVDQDPAKNASLVQSAKTAIGTYVIHLTTLHPEIEEPLRKHASSIRQVHEIANVILNDDAEARKKYEDQDKAACIFLHGDWYRTYRTYVSECASAPAALFAGKKSDDDTAVFLTANDAKFRKEFDVVLRLVPKYLKGLPDSTSSPK